MIHVLREDPTVPDEFMDPILPSCYYGESGSLISELESGLLHRRPIFKNDNAVVCINIEDAARGKSMESSIKSFLRLNEGF